MEIIFENKTAFIYKDLCYKMQCVRDSVDSVVPDVNEDIGRVASVQHCILLKSKDITERGVSIGGEIKLCALYITENEDKVSALNLSKTFNIDFDVPEISADAVAQIKLNLNNIESRIINPRKLAVNYEICGLLSVYTPEECDIESVVPEKDSTLLKQKTETVEIDLPCAVCEKSLIINEQHVLSSIKTNPVRLISADAKLVCGECQHVGTKLIVKGTTYITVTYITENENYPLITEFSANFSQILDTGVENVVHCAVRPELNNLYYELKETINGEYAVDIELHAVLQAACYKTQCLKYISDAYSNKMPIKINSIKCFKTGNSRLQYEKINIDEKLSVSDDCQDILCVLPSLCHTELANNKLTATIHFDIIYQSMNASVCAVRRSTCIESEELGCGARIVSCKLSNIHIKPEVGVIDAKLIFEYTYQCAYSNEYTKVRSVELCEDEKYDLSKLPSFSMVRVENETLWDLAKRYHSSVDRICACNDTGSLDNGFVMIPKEC